MIRLLCRLCHFHDLSASQSSFHYLHIIHIWIWMNVLKTEMDFVKGIAGVVKMPAFTEISTGFSSLTT